MQMGLNSYKLVRPDESFRSQWVHAVEILRETDGKVIPSNLEAANFESFLQQTQDCAEGKNLPSGYVPSELYFLVNEQAPAIILGVTDLRLASTPAIEQYFGHAGGSILPEYRKQGLGKYIINLSIDVLRSKGFASIVLTCENWNEISRRAIIANGGVYQSNAVLGEKIYERYLIDLSL